MRIRNVNWIDLNQLTDEQLRETALEHHVDPYYIVVESRSEPNEKLGRMLTKTVRIRKERTRRSLIDMVENVMSLTYDVPSEFWTDEQAELYKERGIFDIKDGQKEAVEKQKIGIQIVLRDELELDDEVAGLMMERYNFQRKLAQPTKRGPDGRILSTAQWKEVPRVMIEEVKDGEDKPKNKAKQEFKQDKKQKKQVEEVLDEDEAAMV